MGALQSTIGKFDQRLGDGLERTVSAHHRRRLRKLGWGHVLQDRPGWYASNRPIRDGNQVDVLVDGELAMPAIAEAIAGAKSHVHIANWHATPGFRLQRDPDGLTLRELLSGVA